MTALRLVVPVYNEASRIDRTAWLDYLAAQPDASLTFVDDGSRDATAAVIEALCLSAPTQIDLLRLDRNIGKAEAVRRGVSAALESGAPIVGFIDADLSAPLSEVALLLAELEAHPDAWAAFGSRIKLLGRAIDRSERRHYLGRVFATCASLALGLPVYDTQCGLKLFRNVPAVVAAFATPFQSRWIFDVELLARLAGSAGSDISRCVYEVPLRHWHERGASRLRARDFFGAPLELLRIRRRYHRRDA